MLFINRKFEEKTRPADHVNSRKIIVICFEFGSGMRVSHHPEGKVSECAVVREGKERGKKGSRFVLPNVLHIYLG